MNGNMNNFNGFNGFYGNGVVPNQQQQFQQKSRSNWLTKEEMEAQAKEAFSLSVTDQKAITRGLCTHKDANTGAIALGPTENDGTHECPFCHAHIVLEEITQDEIELITFKFTNALQIIKIFGSEIIPEDVGRQFFQLIPLAEKVPELYRMALDFFKKREGVNNFVNGASGTNPMMLMNMLTGSYQPGMMPQQMNGFQQPNMMPQQPMNGFAQPQQGFNNPMYGPQNGMMAQPQMQQHQVPMNNGYQPASTGFNFSPVNNVAPTVNTNMPQQPQTPAVENKQPEKKETTK